MAIYVGDQEGRRLFFPVAGVQRRISSVWVGTTQVFPPANRQEVHVFNADTTGFGRVDHGSHVDFTVPVPWWANAVDVVLLGAGERGRDGERSFTGTDGQGGRAGAWVEATAGLGDQETLGVRIARGTSTSPTATTVDGVATTHGKTGASPSGSTGGAPGNRTAFDIQHRGGHGGARDFPGASPGGGGGGGSGSGMLGSPRPGQPGGNAYAWVRFRSAGLIQPDNPNFVLFVGVTSGFAYGPLREWAESTGQTYETITTIDVPIQVVAPLLRNLFHGCSSLTQVPLFDTSSVTRMDRMFVLCSALTTVPAFDTSNVTDMDRMFSSCSSLTTVPALNAHRVTNIDFAFKGCTSLESVELPGLGQAFTNSYATPGQTLDLSDTRLNPAAANRLMASLGTVPAGVAGTLKLPPTATGADTSIATAKNWRIG